ncbi:unnamed protein product [Closterium sp. Naga37s-1]|nr:unnamed protein product [Closterium sp. Naga37s-1]
MACQLPGIPTLETSHRLPTSEKSQSLPPTSRLRRTGALSGYQVLRLGDGFCLTSSAQAHRGYIQRTFASPRTSFPASCRASSQNNANSASSPGAQPDEIKTRPIGLVPLSKQRQVASAAVTTPAEGELAGSFAPASRETSRQTSGAATIPAAGAVGEELQGRREAGGDDAEAALSALGRLRATLKDMPDRYWVIFSTSLAFVLCNMDKVNLSIAIIPMAHEFGWSATTVGVVQSSFYWGYALSLLPAGWLCQKFTGTRMLRAGVLIWSIATAAIPSAAAFLPSLLFSRVAVGFGEGVAPPAATDIVARSMPAEERARGIAFVFNGFNVGGVVGLLAAPVLIERLGWESMFYIFGFLGILWSVAFNPKPSEVTSADFDESAAASTNQALSVCVFEECHAPGDIVSEDLRESEEERRLVEEGGGADPVVPWGELLRSRAVQAVVYAHFCNNWGHHILLAWLPTYYSKELHLDITQASLLSLLPPLLSIAVSAVVAPAADRLIAEGTDVSLVRKLAQGMAFLGPAACMAVASFGPDHNLPTWLLVAALSGGIGLSACSYAGLYCSHQDISPKHASVLLGMSTTVGAIPGIVGVPLTGYLFDQTHSWATAMFLPSIAFYISGTIMWSLFADCSRANFGEDKAKLKEA